MGGPCAFCSGWLNRFKQRHRIKYLKPCGDSLSAEEFIDYFTILVKEEHLNPQQIYNMNKMGLFLCSLLQKCLTIADE